MLHICESFKNYFSHKFCREKVFKVLAKVQHLRCETGPLNGKCSLQKSENRSQFPMAKCIECVHRTNSVPFPNAYVRITNTNFCNPGLQNLEISVILVKMRLLHLWVLMTSTLREANEHRTPDKRALTMRSRNQFNLLKYT